MSLSRGELRQWRLWNQSMWIQRGNREAGDHHHNATDHVVPKVGNIREVPASEDHCFARYNAPERSAPPHAFEEERQHEDPQHPSVEKRPEEVDGFDERPYSFYILR